MNGLLARLQFGPFFWTQFLGAFNDNVFKNALIIFVSMQGLSESDQGYWVNLASGLFILPFFILSPIAGQIADKYEKARLIRMIKAAEIILMLLGAITLMAQNISLMILVLALMGAQSAFFGPVKYSILPQHIHPNELVRATGLVEMGTFVAILIGTIFGGLLIRWHPYTASIAIILVAVLGYISSLKIPPAKAGDPDLRLTINPIPELKHILLLRKENTNLYWVIIAISWFWFYGATVLAQMPTFVTHGLHSGSLYITFFLTIFTLSIAIGSMVVHRISKREKVDLKVLFLGISGLILFLFDLGNIDLTYSATQPYSLTEPMHHYTQRGVLALLNDWRIVFDFAAIGIFGSFFIVPLYTLLQEKSPTQYRSRIIALNNVLNSLFMVLSAIFCAILFKAGRDTSDIFMLTSLATLIFAGMAAWRHKQWLEDESL